MSAGAPALQLVFSQATGAEPLTERLVNILNHLSLIKDSIQRHQAVTAAQMVSLKAYRGVPYTNLPVAEPVSADLSYRGRVYHIDR